MKQLHPRAVWLFFIKFALNSSLALIIIGIFPGILLFALNLENAAEEPLAFLKWLWIIVPLLFIFFFVWAKLSYRFYRYELGEEGFRKESGVITKHYVTIPYDRIQNVDIYRGIWNRILGISELYIETAGGMGFTGFAGGRLPGLSMKDAEEVRNELIHRVRQSKNQGL